MSMKHRAQHGAEMRMAVKGFESAKRAETRAYYFFGLSSPGGWA